MTEIRETAAGRDGWRLTGGAGTAVFSAVIFLVALGLCLYARALQKRGVLVQRVGRSPRRGG